MQEKSKSTPSAGFNLNLGDIYHVLFRHKWKIVIVWVVGLMAAAGIYFTYPVPWSSEAKLYVRYVKDNKDVNLNGNDSPSIVGTSSGADSVINTEIEMLNSLDVAKEAAEILPPDVMAKLKGGTNTYLAAAIIRNNLQVETASRNPVMHVFFRHEDPAVVQTVLSQVIQSYFKKHQEAHMLVNRDENLTMTTDQLSAQLAQTEKEFREMKSQVGVTQLAETKKLNAERLTKIKEDLWAAETEVAEHQAIINSYSDPAKLLPKPDTNAPAEPAPTPKDKITEYQGLCADLESLQKRKKELLEIYTEQVPRVQRVQEQIDTDQKKKTQLEADFPQLTAYRVVATPTGQPGSPGLDLVAEKNRILALNTKVTRLKEHQKDIEDQIEQISLVEEKLKNLERQRDTQEANLTAFERARVNNRIEAEMSDGKLTNIKIIQKPTPSYPDPSKRNKIVRIAFGGALVLGLALAFAIEFYFDRSFKRPGEIESKLGLPLFLSIPETVRNGRGLLGQKKMRLLTNGHAKNGGDETTPPGEPVELTAWKSNPAMAPFFEALRDRLITHFEIKDINHKPKLVAVTSCTNGSGVSTLASGLAASLSETGEGNVLLVDMNTEKGSAHFFHKGKMDCDLDDVLEKNSNRENAQVEKNLFVVNESAADEKLPRILHKRFSALIPKLHASDFDYIIFDMPPVSQTSATTRVARFMDMVFLVVEAEKTDRDVVKRASKMLAEAKATNVGVVLNKSHNYVPSRLNQEL